MLKTSSFKSPCQALILTFLFLVATNHAGEFGWGPPTAAHPFFAKDDLVFDERLLGWWVVTSLGSNDLRPSQDEIKVERRDALTYRATVKGQTKEAHLFKLKGTLFLDAEEERHRHILFLVPQLEPTLKLSLLGGDELDKLCRKRPAREAPSHPPTAGEPTKASELMEAPTAQLRAFLLAHLDDPALFIPGIELRRGTGKKSQKPHD